MNNNFQTPLFESTATRPTPSTCAQRNSNSTQQLYPNGLLVLIPSQTWICANMQRKSKIWGSAWIIVNICEFLCKLTLCLKFWWKVENTHVYLDSPASRSEGSSHSNLFVLSNIRQTSGRQWKRRTPQNDWDKWTRFRRDPSVWRWLSEIFAKHQHGLHLGSTHHKKKFLSQ